MKQLFCLLLAALLLVGTLTACEKAETPAESVESVEAETPTERNLDIATELPANWADNVPGAYSGGVDGVDFVLNIESGKDIEIIQFTDTQIQVAETARNDLRKQDLTCTYGDVFTYEEKLDKYIRTVLENSDPDLIVITGDLVYGETDDSGEHLQHLIALMDSFETPWAVCFGNHDNESNKGVLWQCEQLASAEYGIFKRGSVTGNSNYNIVLRQDGEIKNTVFLFDTHGCRVLPREGAGLQAENPDYDLITQEEGIFDDQIEWFVSCNEAIQKLAGRETVGNLTFQHIPVREAFVAVNEKYQPNANTTTVRCRQDGDCGFLMDGVGQSWGVDQDGKLLAACRANGTLGMFFGHTHNNDASVLWNGIRYTFGSKTGTYDFYTQALLGGTQIMLDSETGELSVAHLKYDVLLRAEAETAEP